MESGSHIGKWVLGDKLGEGAMGEVWRAIRSDDPGIVAALKLIKGEVTPDRARRFLREAAILADLDHPAVPGLLDYSTHPAFLALDYIEGDSIGALLKREGSFSVANSIEIVMQVVDGLAYVHGRGIWHRDLKPDNLILTEDGWVKLVDFGVARGDGYADLTAVGMVVGTIAYMPPEAFRGTEPDPLAWDLYSAGVVLYRCLTGKNGFENDLSGVASQAEKATQKLALPCIDPGEDYPDDVRSLIRDLTAQRPEDRLTRASEVGRRLRLLMRAHPGSNLVALSGRRTESRLEPERSSRTGLVVAVVVGVVAVLLLVVLLAMAVLASLLVGVVLFV